MATLSCLACGHQNASGDAFCATCNTSLNVRLCLVCEAINAISAERCHACGADVKNVTPEPVMGQKIEVIETERPARWLPSLQIYDGAPKAATVARRAVAVLIFGAVFVAGGVVYHFWSTGGASLPVGSTQAVAGRVSPPAQPKIEPAVIVKQAVPQPPAPSIEAGPSGAITHTRGVAAAAGGAQTDESTTVPVQAPKRKVAASKAAPQALAAPATAPVAAAEPAADTPISRVTHTRKASAGALGTPVEQPSNEPGTRAPMETKDLSPACPPGVMALGLCKQ